jgi:hypothetical protein
MARHENKLIIIYTGMNKIYQNGKLMCIAGRENAGPDDLGTIVAPMPAQDVNLAGDVPDPVLFSYANTEGGKVRLRIVLVKIQSKGGLPSTCTVSVYVPFVDDLWISKTEDVTLTGEDGTPLRNPRGMIDAGDSLSFIDYESRVILTVTEAALEGAGDGENLTVKTLDLSAHLATNAKGQSIIALGGKAYALYIRTNTQATVFYPSKLLRLSINGDGTLSYDNVQTEVGINAQAVIPVLWNGAVWLLIPAIGGRQLMTGATNGVKSNICAVEAEAASWPDEAAVKITGDAYPDPAPEPPDPVPDPTAFNIIAVGAAMRNNDSKVYILAQVYNLDAKSAFWELYRTTVGALLGVENAPTLSDAVTAHVIDSVDEGMVEAADPELPSSVYFWDIVYEQSHRDNEDEDRLWIALGSPLLVTKPGKYSSPSKPDGPFAMYYCIGGENVNSIDLPIETRHQAIRKVSLKRGMLGAVRVATKS